MIQPDNLAHCTLPVFAPRQTVAYARNRTLCNASVNPALTAENRSEYDDSTTYPQEGTSRRGGFANTNLREVRS